MTNVVVRPGERLVTHGTLINGSVTVLGGTAAEPGGVLVVLSSAAAENSGVMIDGSSAPGSRGGYAFVGPEAAAYSRDLYLYCGGGFTPKSAEGAGPTLTVAGSLNIMAGVGVGVINDASGFHVGGSPTINIEAGGTLATASYVILYGSGVPGVAGSVVNDAGIWTSGSYIQFLSRSGSPSPGGGSVLNITGELNAEGGIDCHSGAEAVVDVAASGVLLSSFAVETDSTSSLDVAGTWVNNSFVAYLYGALNVTGRVSNNDSLTLADTATISGTLTNGVVGGQVGFFNMLGGVPNADQADVAGSTLDLSGSLDNYVEMQVRGGAAYKPAHSGASGYGGLGALLIDSGILLNDGSIYLGAGQTGATPAASGHAAILSITSTGQLTGTGTITGGGTIENLGIIHTSGNALLLVGEIVNDGAISLSIGGALTIAGSITADPGAAGSLTIAADSALTLDGAASRDQSVSFAGLGATLALADARGFAGVLTGLGAGASIDFLNLDIAAAHAAGTILGIDVAGGGTFDLTLGAVIANYSTLNLTSDGHGGTDLSILTTANIGAQPASPTTIALNSVGTDTARQLYGSHAQASPDHLFAGHLS